MRIFAVHFLSSRQRLIGRQSGTPWIQGREAAEMPGANASPSENLTASGKLFFYAIARALWQKNKIRNFGNVQNS